MNFTLVGSYEAHPVLRRFAEGLRATLEAHGHQYAEERGRDLRLVFNFIDPERPRPYRRRAKATFVVSVALGSPGVEDVLRAAYPLLVRSLANLVIYLVPEGEGWRTYFVTLEQGRYEVPGEGDVYFERVYERLYPLATSQLVIDNEFHPDLPEELWEGDALTQKLSEAGRRLDALQLLPSPFPHRGTPEPPGSPARAAPVRHRRTQLREPQRTQGRHPILDERERGEQGKPPGHRPGHPPREGLRPRSKPDPPERPAPHPAPTCLRGRHRALDDLHGAPLRGRHHHVHAWMRGIPSTEINYPCGTLQLAKAVAELVRQAPDPARAVVGLKNHGITVTGPDLEDILERLERDIIRQVPMT
jgi:hypothetical protein